MDGFLKKTGLGRSNHKTVVIFGLSPHEFFLAFLFVCLIITYRAGQYGRLDTLNSKICPLVMILSLVVK